MFFFRFSLFRVFVICLFLTYVKGRSWNSGVLNGTGLKVSRVCLGTMTFGSQVDETVAASMVDYCLERGVQFIDTANVYNGGEAERILGKILQGRRERVVLASKVGLKMGDGADDCGLSRAAIVKGAEDCLRGCEPTTSTSFISTFPTTLRRSKNPSKPRSNFCAGRRASWPPRTMRAGNSAGCSGSPRNVAWSPCKSSSQCTTCSPAASSRNCCPCAKSLAWQRLSTIPWQAGS